MLVISVAFLFRVLIFWLFSWEERITDSYEVIAVNLLSGKGFSYNSMDPTVCRMPVYPFWLSFLLFIFGYDPIPYTALRFAEVLIDSLTAVFVLRLASTWFPNLRSSQLLGAGIAYAINPFSAYYSVKLGSETLATASLVLFLIGFHGAFVQKKTKLRSVLLTGVLGGFLVLNKSVFIPVVLLLPIVSFLALRQISLRKFSTLFIQYALIASLVVTPWVFRNVRATEGKIVFQTLSGFNFWYDFSLDKNRNQSIISENWDTAYIGDTVFVVDGVRYAHYDLAASVDVMYDRIMVRKAFQWIASNPMSFLGKTIDNMFAFWYQLETPKKMLAGGIFSLSSLLIALFSIRSLASCDHEKEAIFFAMTILLVDIVYSPILAVFRYSLVIHPLLLTLVGSFIVEQASRVMQKYKSRSNSFRRSSS